MKLSRLMEDFVGAFLLAEGYGRTQSFDYEGWKNDPSPQVLQLGNWVHPSTGNTLVGGVNINYLDPDQIERLRYYLPEILKHKHLKLRYWTGMRLLPDIFKNSYRTYNQDKIKAVTPGALSFMTGKELEKKGSQDKAQKLNARRERLKRLKLAQKQRERELLGRAKKVPIIPPEPEDQISTQIDPKSSDQKGKEATRVQRQDRMSQRIDQRTRDLVKQQQVPPPVDPLPGQINMVPTDTQPGQDSPGAPFGEAPMEEPPIPPTVPQDEVPPEEPPEEPEVPDESTQPPGKPR